MLASPVHSPCTDWVSPFQLRCHRSILTLISIFKEHSFEALLHSRASPYKER